MVKFLIIVPTLNSYKLLPKLIRSLETQTFQNWKLIFVDGNSNTQHKKFLQSICKENKKFEIINQSKKSKGIYGAMNDGIKISKKSDWILFWGSDDWANNKNILSDLNEIIHGFSEIPDLIISEAAYYNKKLQKTRISKFRYLINFRFSLFMGSSPPHQGTIFSPNVIKKINFFNENISLSADLDYFLNLSKFNNLKIHLLKKNIVSMGDGGISGLETKKRFYQVIQCYKKRYGFLMPIPFIMRYAGRFLDLINK